MEGIGRRRGGNDIIMRIYLKKESRKGTMREEEDISRAGRGER